MEVTFTVNDTGWTAPVQRWDNGDLTRAVRQRIDPARALQIRVTIDSHHEPANNGVDGAKREVFLTTATVYIDNEPVGTATR